MKCAPCLMAKGAAKEFEERASGENGRRDLSRFDARNADRQQRERTIDEFGRSWQISPVKETERSLLLCQRAARFG
jgi:hypothetical protein